MLIPNFYDYILEFKTPYMSDVNSYLADVSKYHGYNYPILDLLWDKFKIAVMTKEAARKKDKEEQEPKKEPNKNNKYFKDINLVNKEDTLKRYITKIEIKKRELSKSTIGKIRLFKIHRMNVKVVKKHKEKAIEYLKNNTLPLDAK